MLSVPVCFFRLAPRPHEEVDGLRPDSAFKSFARGVMWLTAGTVGGRLATLVSSVLLARLLLPEHFGLFSAAMIVVSAVQILPDLGLSQAIIAHGDAGQRASSTSFYAILFTSTALAVAVFASADLVATLAREPDLAPVLRVLAVNIVVFATASVPIALMQKAQRWRAQAVVEFASPAISAVVMVLMAYWGFGVWSIVAGYLTRSAVLAFSVWVLSRWRPSGGIDWQLLRSLFRFSRWIVIERFSAFLLFTIDNAYLARWQGARMLGYYALPYNWISVPVQYFAVQSSRVLFPVLSALEEASQRKVVLLRACATLSFVVSPIYLFWVLHAPLFVEALFGAKWLPSVPVLQWLAIYALAYSLAGGIFTSFYWSMRRPQLVVYPTWAALLVAGAGLVWSRGNWDALAVAKWFTLAIYVRATLVLVALRWCGDFRLVEVLRAVGNGVVPALLASVLSAILAPLVALPSLAKLVVVGAAHVNFYLLLYGFLRERRPLAYYNLQRLRQILGVPRVPG